MSISKPSDKELQEASDWLLYEYWMIKGLCNTLNSGKDVIEIGIIRNAILDSLLIHTRELSDFFFREPRKADVVAPDYLDGQDKANWKKTHGSEPNWLKTVRERINTSVAHISYNRVKSTWDYNFIEQEIDLLFREFVQFVPVSRLGTRWKPIIKNTDFRDRFIDYLPDFWSKPDTLRTSFFPKAASDPNWYPGQP